MRSGFYINPAAAPGRIALAFLCTLIVLTNVNSVYAQLREIHVDSHVDGRVRGRRRVPGIFGKKHLRKSIFGKKHLWETLADAAIF